MWLLQSHYKTDRTCRCTHVTESLFRCHTCCCRGQSLTTRSSCTACLSECNASSNMKLKCWCLKQYQMSKTACLSECRSRCFRMFPCMYWLTSVCHHHHTWMSKVPSCSILSRIQEQGLKRRRWWCYVNKDCVFIKLETKKNEWIFKNKNLQPEQVTTLWLVWDLERCPPKKSSSSSVHDCVWDSCTVPHVTNGSQGGSQFEHPRERNPNDNVNDCIITANNSRDDIVQRRLYVSSIWIICWWGLA